MNSVTLLALFIFTCTSRAGRTSYWDFIELGGEHFSNEIFEDAVTYTPKSEDSSEGLTTTESFQTTSSHFQRLQKEDQQKRELAEEDEKNNGTSAEDVLKHSIEDPTPLHSELNEVNVDKRYSHFIVHPIDYHDSKISFQKEDPKSYQTPQRRQIKEWRVSDDFFESNNVPWGSSTYFPKLGKSEYIEDSIYSEDKGQEGPSLIVAGDYKDHDIHGKHPQYFQKNYYYNYYPLISDRNKWNSEEVFISDDPKKRKYPSTNPCRQYLEFLKYAFERLDEKSEYDETHEEYSEEYRDPDPEKTNRVFGTQLLGPTFYVDNSGKISQVNTNGNSIQVAEGISPDSKISIFSNTMPEIKTVTHEIIIPTTEPSTTQTLRSIEIVTTQRNIETETPTIAAPRTTVWETEKQPITTTSAPIVVELTTTEENEPTTIQEYYGRMGGSVERKLFLENQATTTTISPQRTTTPPENRVNIKTLLKIENSTTKENNSDEADCKDKMLPCPDTVNITYPLNGYCNRYVSCESGRAIRRTCPEGLHFNLITKSCDLPHNSFCTYVCPQPNGNFGIPGDCGGYFVCKNSNPEYRMCPPRMHWDISKGICTFAQLSSCPMKCYSDNEVRHYEGDCKAYIVCLNGIPYYHKCPPNTKFDEKSMVCVPDHVSKCVDDPRLLTKTVNPNVLCKDIEIQLNTKSWCRSFLPFDKEKS